MKTNGITRRVDELGRVVIPKTFRSNLRIKSGDSLEVFSDQNKIIIQKKETIKGLPEYLYALLNIVSKALNADILITDTDKYIFTSGSNFECCLNQEINSNIYKIIMSRKTEKVNNYVFFNKKVNILLKPILINGDILGSVILLKKNEKIVEIDEVICDIFIKLLINFLEF